MAHTVFYNSHGRQDGWGIAVFAGQARDERIARIRWEGQERDRRGSSPDGFCS